MNYTMELEGKLHDLSLEADKLSSQLHILSKQEGTLRASKADLEQQVGHCNCCCVRLVQQPVRHQSFCHIVTFHCVL
jgi:hypothetical protein